MSKITFEQAWSVQTDIAKACREFNELQFKYRQLAISLILAAYAAMGYFFVLAEPGAKAAAAASPQQAASAAAAAEKASDATSPNRDPDAGLPSAGHARRISLLLLAIGVFSTISTFSIFLLDASVYHRLLRACFDKAIEFEKLVEGVVRGEKPPAVHGLMQDYVSGPAVRGGMWGLYSLGTLAGLVPWCVYNYLNTRLVQTQQLTDAWTKPGFSIFVLVLVGVFDASIFWFMRGAIKNEEANSAKRIADASTETAATPAPNTGTASTADALLEAAKAAHANAYDSYSRYAVGASVLAAGDSDERVFSGCNVENAAYGSTLCAERNAIAAAIAAGYRDIKSVVVYTEGPVLTPPCGACRQVMHEFNPDMEVRLETSTGTRKTFTLPNLFPHAFGPANLNS